MKSRKHRSIKRLKHHYHRSFKNLPYVDIHLYTRYFDYPLSELLVDHSTNPMENTARQYILSDIPNQSRFVNHEMIIRKNGESTILRAKHDIVLDNGFTSIIRPCYLLSSYQSTTLYSQIASSSSSIINKMSVTKSEQKIIKKRKRKRKSKVNSNNQSTLIVKENNCLQPRVPFQDLSSKISNNSQNPLLIQELEDICFNRNTIDKQQPKSKFLYDLPIKGYCNFEENNQFHDDCLLHITCLNSSDIIKIINESNTV